MQKIVFINILTLTLACTPADEETTTLKYPIPQPVPEKKYTPPPINDDADEENTNNTVVERAKDPFFISKAPSTISIKENELWSIEISAKDPNGLPINYFYQCPYACVSGMEISPNGVVSWRPSFSDAGSYDLRFMAINSNGDIGFSDYIRFEIVNQNRPPKVDRVAIEPNSLENPTSLFCRVEKSDPDNDAVTTERVWSINGVINNLLTSNQISISTFLAGDSIACRVKVTDELSLASDVVESEAYVIPNKPPTIEVVEVRNLLGGQSLKVGDIAQCFFQAQDLDGNPISVSQAILKSGNRIVKLFGPSEPLTYTLTAQESHSNLSCYLKVTDGFSFSEKTSALVAMQNSVPVITNVRLEPLSGSSLLTGETARCLVDFNDPDGDFVSSIVTFTSNGLSRGNGTLESFSSNSIIRRYTLRTRSEVLDPVNADVKGARIACSAEIRDNYGAVATRVSSENIVADRHPTLTISNGSSSQTIYTGQALSPITLSGVDLDGDVVTFNKITDNCIDRGITINVSALGLISSNNVPSASYPQYSRDCGFSINARASGVDTATLSFSISIPNRAPTLTCSSSGVFGTGENPVVRVLSTGSENFQRILLSPGQEIGKDFVGNDILFQKIICSVTDQDGTTASSTVPPNGNNGDSFEFQLIQDSEAPCVLSGFESQSLRLTPAANGFSRNIEGAMGLDGCNAKVRVLDGSSALGGLVSNEVTIELKPLIDFKLPEAVSFNNSCRLGVSGAPIFNDGYTYNAISPATADFDDLNSLIGLGNYGASQNEAWAIIPLSILNNNGAPSAPGSGVELSWSMRGVKDTSVVTRTVRRKWDISPRPTDDSLSYPLFPQNILGEDFGEGSQVAPSDSCVNNQSCLGERASIAVGARHSCVVFNSTGLVACWGANDFKQLGYGVISDQNTPVFVSGISGLIGDRVVSLAAGEHHTCSLMDNGKVKCWGHNGWGQLGRGAAEVGANAAVNEARLVKNNDGSDLSGVVAIAMGSYHSCALLSSGAVSCWGAGDQGQTGFKTSDEFCNAQSCFYTARPVPGINNVKGVFAGGKVTCAVVGEGEARCWGQGEYGQLASGNFPNLSSYVAPYAMVGVSSAASISIGERHSCVIGRSGTVQCSGEGFDGELGDGQSQKTSSLSTPAYAVGAAHVAAGELFTCLITPNMRIECFGRNQISTNVVGRLGGGILSPTSSSRVRVKKDSDGSELSGVIALSSGKNHSCAVTKDKEVYCWGAGDRGQLGHGMATTAVNGAVMVSGGAISNARSCTEYFRLEKR